MTLVFIKDNNLGRGESNYFSGVNRTKNSITSSLTDCAVMVLPQKPTNLPVVPFTTRWKKHQGHASPWTGDQSPITTQTVASTNCLTNFLNIHASPWTPINAPSPQRVASTNCLTNFLNVHSSLRNKRLVNIKAFSQTSTHSAAINTR